jgi:hypothetical protein
MNARLLALSHSSQGLIRTRLSVSENILVSGQSSEVFTNPNFIENYQPIATLRGLHATFHFGKDIWNDKINEIPRRDVFKLFIGTEQPQGSYSCA